MDWSLVGTGSLVGLLVGLSGVGGGALTTPILLLAFGVAPLTAVGTDLWFAGVTKIFATHIHHGHRLIIWQIVKRMWMGSLPAAALTLLWITFSPLDAESTNFLKAAIATAVILTGIGMLLQKPLQALGARIRGANIDRFKHLQTPLTVAAGAVLGIMVTLTSIGAGALGVVFLTHLYPLHLTPPRLIATDIAHAIPLALFAGMGHFFIGNVEFTLLGHLLLGSIPGVMIGAMLSSRLPHLLLRMILAMVLLSVGIKLYMPAAG